MSQDATRSTGDSGTPRFNVSCQTCRISKTFLTLQGTNAFFDDHEGHTVIEGRLFERPETSKKAEGITEEVSNPRAEEAPEVVEESGMVMAQELTPRLEDGADAETSEETQAPPSLVVQSTEIELKEPVSEAPPLLSEEDLKEPLLLARSSYIGESDEKRIDALIVSRALREFKWNVEPPYVIGIMVDDNLSVETNIGVISSSMVERVEKLGYKFVAMNSPQGSPVAWFKREVQGALETHSRISDTERTMKISQRKRTYDEDRAVWQESFVSLLMTVKDMDGQKLKRVTNILKSEHPEPDLQ
jgi:hypothetical protein